MGRGWRASRPARTAGDPIRARQHRFDNRGITSTYSPTYSPTDPERLYFSHRTLQSGEKVEFSCSPSYFGSKRQRNRRHASISNSTSGATRRKIVGRADTAVARWRSTGIEMVKVSLLTWRTDLILEYIPDIVHWIRILNTVDNLHYFLYL